MSLLRRRWLFWSKVIKNNFLLFVTHRWPPQTRAHYFSLTLCLLIPFPFLPLCLLKFTATVLRMPNRGSSVPPTEAEASVEKQKSIQSGLDFYWSCVSWGLNQKSCLSPPLLPLFLRDEQPCHTTRRALV